MSDDEIRVVCTGRGRHTRVHLAWVAATDLPDGDVFVWRCPKCPRRVEQISLTRWPRLHERLVAAGVATLDISRIPH